VHGILAQPCIGCSLRASFIAFRAAALWRKSKPPSMLTRRPTSPAFCAAAVSALAGVQHISYMSTVRSTPNLQVDSASEVCESLQSMSLATDVDDSDEFEDITKGGGVLTAGDQLEPAANSATLGGACSAEPPL
jgi:hypothetical protein